MYSPEPQYYARPLGGRYGSPSRHDGIAVRCEDSTYRPARPVTIALPSNPMMLRATPEYVSDFNHDCLRVYLRQARRDTNLS
jgi:hypothetical protein